MKAADIVVLRGNAGEVRARPGQTVMAFGELRRRLLAGRVLALLGRWRRAELLTHRLDALPKPFNTALVVRLLSRGPCSLRDERGGRRPVTAAVLARLFARLLRDLRARPALLRRVGAWARDLEARAAARPARRRLRPGAPAYLRADLIYALRSGGSVGHIAGVLNHLDAFGRRPIFITPDPIPTVRPKVATHVVPPPPAFWDFRELPALAFNEHLCRAAREVLRGSAPAFLYHRYCLHSLAGLALAEEFDVPFVLEYNGSEVWVARHWGQPLKHEALAGRIERLNLAGADLVVVVSDALKEELLARGVAPGKVLVNPNGVDVEAYGPHVDGSGVRSRLGLEGCAVVGFIGTFGRWHGAEVLAEAFGRLVRTRPELRASVRLLMIGDGVTMPQVKANLERHGAADLCVLTGTVPQEQGPAHLAACDVLVSPHVPNPDGTPFFGSPTKLFEYMAMGKGIVASELDQIGQVLRHDRTAWMVRPGDAAALAAALEAMIDDPARRQRLGGAARQQALARHTWRRHTERILQALRERCG